MEIHGHQVITKNYHLEMTAENSKSHNSIIIYSIKNERRLEFDSTFSSFFSGELLFDRSLSDRDFSFISAFSSSISVKLWASARLSTAMAKKTFSKISERWSG